MSVIYREAGAQERRTEASKLPGYAAIAVGIFDQCHQLLEPKRSIPLPKISMQITSERHAYMQRLYGFDRGFTPRPTEDALSAEAKQSAEGFVRTVHAVVAWLD